MTGAYDPQHVATVKARLAAVLDHAGAAYGQDPRSPTWSADVLGCLAHAETEIAEARAARAALAEGEAG